MRNAVGMAAFRLLHVTQRRKHIHPAIRRMIRLALIKVVFTVYAA